MTLSQQAPLVERLKSSAEAFRRYPVYTVDGDAVKLKVRADEAEEAAARITELEAANGRLARLGRALERELDKGFARAERAEARCRALQEALGGLTALYDDDEGCRKLPEYVAAVQALEGALPESPSADAGPRSHEGQRSDGGRG